MLNTDSRKTSEEVVRDWGLAAILGHSNLNTVMIYTTPTTEDLAARMEKAEVGDK
jgi:hypothetical protein